MLKYELIGLSLQIDKFNGDSVLPLLLTWAGLIFQACGNVNKTAANVKKLGKYVFVEVDRSGGESVDDESDTKDISLYSLKLEPRYDLAG